jgi:hypothetical protein
MTKSQFSKSLTVLVLSVLFSISSVSIAQNFPLISQAAVINVHGTSNVHDWDMKPTTVAGELGLNDARQISSIAIKIEVKSLKSGNGIMDGKTHDAFNYKVNPYIVFVLTDASQAKLTVNDTEIILTGNLSFSGQTRKISIKTIGKITKSRDYQLKGSVPLKMTDYKMKPPTAMLGTMKTGDAVTVEFDVTFKG